MQTSAQDTLGAPHFFVEDGIGRERSVAIKRGKNEIMIEKGFLHNGCFFFLFAQQFPVEFSCPTKRWLKKKGTCRKMHFEGRVRNHDILSDLFSYRFTEKDIPKQKKKTRRGEG